MSSFDNTPVHGHCTWVAQPASSWGCRVDAVHGEFEAFEGSVDVLLTAVATLARSKLLLPSHAPVDVCAFVVREDSTVERAIIGVV